MTKQQRPDGKAQHGCRQAGRRRVAGGTQRTGWVFQASRRQGRAAGSARQAWEGGRRVAPAPQCLGEKAGHSLEMMMPMLKVMTKSISTAVQERGPGWVGRRARGGGASGRLGAGARPLLHGRQPGSIAVADTEKRQKGSLYSNRTATNVKTERTLLRHTCTGKRGHNIGARQLA